MALEKEKTEEPAVQAAHFIMFVGGTTHASVLTRRCLGCVGVSLLVAIERHAFGFRLTEYHASFDTNHIRSIGVRALSGRGEAHVKKVGSGCGVSTRPVLRIICTSTPWSV